MFRRKFSKTRRKFTRRAPLARVRRTWETSFQSGCGLDLLPLSNDGEVCDNHLTIALVGNSTLEAKFSDRANVKRVVGDLWFLPSLLFPGGTALSDQQTSLFSFYPACRWIMTESEVTSGNPTPTQYDLISSSVDYSENMCKRSGQHLWTPFDGGGATGNLTQMIGGNLNIPTMCSVVHTTGTGDNDFVDGTGTINIDTDCTLECHACPQDTNDFAASLALPFPRPWHWHIDWRGNIRVRENQVPYLQFVFGNASGVAVPNVTSVQMFFWGGIKTLLQF